MGLNEPFEWLDMTFTRQLLGKTIDPIASYREFIMQGNDKETVKFHKSGRIGSVFGSDLFKSWVFDDLMPQLKDVKRTRAITPNLSIERVILAVAGFYQVAAQSILISAHGKVKENLPRKVAMVLCQELTGCNQAQIAEIFHLGNYCSIGRATHEVRVRKLHDQQIASQIQEIIKRLL